MSHLKWFSGCLRKRVNFDPSVSGSILTAPLPSGSKVIWHESPLCLQINPLPAWPQPSAEGKGRPCHRELLGCHCPLKDALSFETHSLLPLHEHEMINSTGNRTIQKRPLPAGHGPRSVRSTGGRGGWGIRKLSVSTQKMGLWLESDPALALGAARIRGMNTKRGGGFNQAHISDVLPGGPPRLGSPSSGHRDPPSATALVSSSPASLAMDPVPPVSPPSLSRPDGCPSESPRRRLRASAASPLGLCAQKTKGMNYGCS